MNEENEVPIKATVTRLNHSVIGVSVQIPTDFYLDHYKEPWFKSPLTSALGAAIVEAVENERPDYDED